MLQRFAAAGFQTIDLDQVAHEVMAPGGPAYADVVSTFGESILGADETIDRRRLGEIVFADDEARRRLNGLVHPRVRDAEAQRIQGMGDSSSIVVTDAALLVESGIHLRFDRLVVAYCSPEEQLRRLMARDRIDEAAASRRIAAQMPIDDKVGFAHLGVETNGTLEDTDARADQAAALLKELSLVPRSPLSVEESRAASLAAKFGVDGPRGLTAPGVAERIAEDGGMEMEGLARLLNPPTKRPWYEAARDGAIREPVEPILVPVVRWALERCGRDDDYIRGAAISLARLVAADTGDTVSAAARIAERLAG